MKHTITSKLICGIGAVATTRVVTLVAGCESTDGGNTGGGNINSGTNYGTGMNDPWAPGGPSTTINPTTGAGGR